MLPLHLEVKGKHFYINYRHNKIFVFIVCAVNNMKNLIPLVFAATENTVSRAALTEHL